MFAQIQLTTSEFGLYIILLNAAIGFVLGLIPLLFGYFGGKLRTGLIGILAATLGGAIAGVFLSIPLFAIFTWLIVRKSKTDTPVDADDVEQAD